MMTGGPPTCLTTATTTATTTPTTAAATSATALHHSATSNPTASNLRWRARVTKEATICEQSGEEGTTSGTAANHNSDHHPGRKHRAYGDDNDVGQDDDEIDTLLLFENPSSTPSLLSSMHMAGTTTTGSGNGTQQQSSRRRDVAWYEEDAMTGTFKNMGDTTLLVRGTGSTTENPTGMLLAPTRFQFWSTLLVDVMAATAVGCSVYVQTVLLATRTVATPIQWIHWLIGSGACLCTGMGAVLIQWQYRQLRQVPTLRRQQNQTRRMVHVLQQQNEKIRRGLILLDQNVEELKQVEQQLKTYTTRGESLDRLVSVLQEHRLIQEQIQEMTRRQIQELILRAVLQSDHNRDYTLTGPELERLLVRLKHIPGVQIREKQLRALVVRNDEGTASSSTGTGISLNCILHLLRKTMDDSYKTHQRGSSLVNVDDDDDDDDDDDATIFRFNPCQLIEQHQD